MSHGLCILGSIVCQGWVELFFAMLFIKCFLLDSDVKHIPYPSITILAPDWFKIRVYQDLKLLLFFPKKSNYYFTHESLFLSSQSEVKFSETVFNVILSIAVSFFYPVPYKFKICKLVHDGKNSAYFLCGSHFAKPVR